MKKWILVVSSLVFLLGACSESSSKSTEEGEEQTSVKVMLDWFPNTNHTGLYVAKEKGYFEEEGLDVEILQPGENANVNSMVASGEIDFGVGYQEGVTQARDQGIPLVSIGAILQHNTSMFASLEETDIHSVKDFEGKRYGGWGSPVEEAMLQAVMKQAGADYSSVENINVGATDFFKAIGRDADFMWIYYGWDGVEAERRGKELNLQRVRDLHPALDYYTPLLTTSESLMKDKPDVAEAFMHAVTKGYEDAIQNPEEAASMLIEANPELNEELVYESQEWLSPRYQEDASQWGIQEVDRWEDYGNWMKEQGLIQSSFDAESAFTNEFLPEGD
ncbi:nitrate ABC transporter substrate-binding protein [Pontibacillus halophilus JSM 076056 = DSM 19796]|uniref:Nitrate ABC transporter substrate-binding protein n=1 Tax=Pontibacillus halophilus JSM 076056 = DSM 19796 TaxID=1385510 RepID=A0A0A5GH19_9BACI|nr:ABC transporter substrate-binding protein [Pontibacillus halophilus]KGX91329.1 nitrate ABC transporter substrate-binding protein [Pontibacillus halophilus JSM 076056 = DSM 19796]